MTVRITTTTGIDAGDPQVDVKDFRDEDLPRWVPHLLEDAVLVTVTYPDDRLVQYERTEP